jgi:carbon monoxide dehydrogenase subunit G
MRFEASIKIKAKAEYIWEAVIDPESWPDWTAAISKVKKLSNEPLGVASKLSVTICIIIPIRLMMTVTEFVHREKVTIDGTVLLGKMTRYYMLKPDNGHTVVIAGGELSGPFSPLVWPFAQAISAKILRDLRKKIEG